MPILIACSCGKKLKVRDELAGKKVKCPGCGGIVVADAAAEEVEEVPVQPPPLPKAKPASVAGASATASASCWECTRDFSTGLLVIADDALWFAKLADKELQQAKELLEEGDAPEDVLDEKTTQNHIPYEKLLGISFNKRIAQMQAEFPGADENETATFQFEDHAARDAAFKDLRRRLGADWTYQRRDLNRFQAMFAPLVGIAITAAVFGFFVFLAWAFEQPTDGQGRVVRARGWAILVAYTVGWLGPLWTGVIGGVFVLICFAWMGFRIADPPIEITLKPPPVDKEAEVEDNEEEEERPRPKKKRRPEDDD